MKTLAAFSLLFSLLVWQNSAFACSCRPEGPIAQDYKDSGVVFKGTLVKKVWRDMNNDDRSEQPTDFEYTFRKTKEYKGDIDQRVLVYSDIQSSMCGLDLKPGKSYVVWVYRSPEGSREYSVNICGRTKLVADAQEDIKWLDKNAN